MKKVLLSLAAILTTAFAITGIASAAAEPGQVEGGNIYWAKNITQGGAFVDPASATCSDTVQFRVRIHNPGPSALTNVNVRATLPGGVAASHMSTITMSSASAQPSTTADTANLNVSPAAALAYVPGSTELLDGNGSKIATLGETIFSSGVTIDTVEVSTQLKRFVQFSVKVNCPEAPAKKITVCELATKKVITIDEKDFNASRHSTDLNKCKEVPLAQIKVCELATKSIVNIYEKDFNTSKYSKDLSKCNEEVKKIQVCELKTKKLVVINEKDFDAAKHSKNMNDCKETSAPGKVQVCDVATKTVITINEDEFDAAKHSNDLNDCGGEVLTEVTPQETPTVIPATGSPSMFIQLLGATSLVGTAAAFIISRRLLG